MTRSLRILCQFDWPTGAVSRLWDGAGPFLDTDGNLWSGVSLVDGLDEIEQAINGEALSIAVTLTGVGDAAELVWLSYTQDEIVGAVMRLLIQPCDDADQPIGAPEVMFVGRAANIVFDDMASGEGLRSTMAVEVENRFTLRHLTNGGVLSDPDQRARSAAVNPEEEPDRFAERVPSLEDKTVAWPKWR